MLRKGLRSFRSLSIDPRVDSHSQITHRMQTPRQCSCTDGQQATYSNISWKTLSLAVTSCKWLCSKGSLVRWLFSTSPICPSQRTVFWVSCEVFIATGLHSAVWTVAGPPVALCDSPGKEVRKCWDCFTELSWPHLPRRPLPYFWSPFQGMGAATNGPEVWESLPHLAGRQGTGEVGQSLWLAVPVGTLNMTFGKLVFPRQGRQGCLLRRLPIVQSLEDLESRKSWGPPSKLHKVVWHPYHLRFFSVELEKSSWVVVRKGLSSKQML